MNIPNILTVIRFLLIPVFAYQYIVQGNVAWAAIILVLSGVTDVLDGYIARRYNLVTKWGVVFDPIADKLTQLTVAFCIAFKGLELMWIAFGLMLAKELVLVCGGIKLYRKADVVVPANWFGKVATLVFYLVFFMLILFGNQISEEVKETMVIVALSLSIFALFSYIINFFKIQKNFFK